MRKNGGLVMTLYIDVYFLINLTVDMLALVFAASLCRMPTSPRRLILCAFIGAAGAVGSLFLSSWRWLTVLMSVWVFAFFAWMVAREASLFRRLRFAVAALLMEILFGGAVYYAYAALDRMGMAEKLTGGGVNRRYLIFAVILLLAVGAIRLIRLFFSGMSSERTATLHIAACGKEITVCGLVDTGNLLRDPMDGTPVVLLTERCAAPLVPAGWDPVRASDLPSAWQTRLRLIPREGGRLALAFRPERAEICRGDRKESLRITIAVDKEEGRFGGYDALIPAAALDNGIF